MIRRRSRSSIIWTAVTVCALTASLAACSSSGGGSPAADGSSVTLSVAADFGTSTDQDHLNSLVTQFEAANPKIKIKIAYTPVATFDQVLGTEVASGNLPDIIYSSPGTARTSGVLALAQKGVLLDLSDQKWTSQIPSAFKNLVGMNGKIYGWPQEINFEGSIYNMSTLNKVGVTPPTTWSQVLPYCQKMKAAGVAPYTINVSDEFGGFQLLYSLVATTVYAQDPNWDIDRVAGKTTFAGTSGWADAMNEMLQMDKAGCFIADPTSVTIAQSESQLATGKAGGFPILSVVEAQAQAAAPNDHYTFVPFPAADSTNWVVSGPVNAWSVAKNTKHEEQALAWMNFITAGAQNRALATENGAIAMVDYAAGVLPSYFDPQFTTLVKNNHVAGIPGLNWAAGVQDTVLGPGMQGLFLGKTSVSALLSQMDAAWKTTS